MRSDLALDSDGARLFAAVLDEDQLGRLEALDDAGQPGIRLYAALMPIGDMLGRCGALGALAGSLLGAGTRPVRAILFDKRGDMNWVLGLHQDRTIAVRERRDVKGYGPWSVKAGQVHVQPPQHVIDRMITLRVHLDDVDADNAPLVILRGSHARGLLTEAEIAALAAHGTSYRCLARRGDVWAYRTAIVHGSDTVRLTGRRRRVLQVDWSAEALPAGLEWALDL